MFATGLSGTPNIESGMWLYPTSKRLELTTSQIYPAFHAMVYIKYFPSEGNSIIFCIFSVLFLM